MITITHLGRPVTMGVPSDGSIVSSHFSNADVTFPANIQTGQGDQLTFQYDSTTPTATQGIIWDRGGGTDVYLRYNPTSNIIDLFEKLIILENIIKCAEELTGRNSETP